MRLAVLLALAASALAGCGDPGAPPPAADGEEPAAMAPQPSVQEFPFGIGVGAGTPALGTILPVDDERQVSFEVPEGHALLEATAAWACDVAAACELDLELRRGEQSLQTAAFGPSPITLTLEEPEAGRYTFWAFPSQAGSVVVGMQGTLTVQLS